MTEINGYQQSDDENHIEVVDLPTLGEEAQKVIPTGGFGYISGGSENDWTEKVNQQAFTHKQIVPRVLSGVDNPSTETSLLGIDTSMPILMTPLAAHGLAHSQGEKDTAKGAAAAGTIMSSSTYSTFSIQDIAAAGNGAPQFFQLYLSKNWDINEAWLSTAVKSGVKAIILTADATVGGYREADIINNFKFPMPMANLENISKNSQNGQGTGIKEIFASAAQKITPDDIKRIADFTKLPVFVKGIQSPEDAMLAIGGGAAGVWISNHGGRQLNGGPASFDVLPAVAKAVGGRVPVIFDSGIRRGSDVFKALASGADMVAIGRPVIYGLALGGAPAVEDVFNHLNMELKTVMQLAGTKNIAEVKEALMTSFNY